MNLNKNKKNVILSITDSDYFSMATVFRLNKLNYITLTN